MVTNSLRYSHSLLSCSTEKLSYTMIGKADAINLKFVVKNGHTLEMSDITLFPTSTVQLTSQKSSIKNVIGLKEQNAILE